MEKDVSHVPTKPIYNSNGRAIVGSALQVAREVKLKSLQEGKEQTMTKVAKAEQSLELARARHFEACKLTITEQRIDEYQNGSITQTSLQTRQIGVGCQCMPLAI